MLLALVAAAIVRSYDRSWLPVPLATLAARAGVSPERVSRLKARLLPGLVSLLEKFVRPGRPPEEEAEEVAKLAERVALLEELLQVASGMLAELGIRGRVLQDRLVAACEKLVSEGRTTVEAFADLLKIPARTLRHWRRRARKKPAVPNPPPPPAPSPKEPAERRRGRFAPARTLPGIQLMGDTTNTEVLSVPLKLVGFQDPGARDEELLAEFSLSTTETAELVAETADRLLEKLPGLQLVTDQGKPYMARLVQELCDTREVDHAPAPEGTPTAKATLERAFRTVKSALSPLLELTNRAAEALPELKDTVLASSLGTLLFATGLRIYSFASRERPRSEAARPADRESLAAIAEEQREKSRSERRSRRLLLEQIHREYGMPGSQEAFVRRFKGHHPEDLCEAQKQLSRVHCCCRIRTPDRYFAAILWRVASEGASRRARVRRQTKDRAQARQRHEAYTHELTWLKENPDEWVLCGLNAIAGQYKPELGDFHAGGRVFGLAPLRKSLRQLVASTALPDEAIRAAWSRWEGLRAEDDPGRTNKVKVIFLDLVNEVLATTPSGTGGVTHLADLARTAT